MLTMSFAWTAWRHLTPPLLVGAFLLGSCSGKDSNDASSAANASGTATNTSTSSAPTDATATTSLSTGATTTGVGTTSTTTGSTSAGAGGATATTGTVATSAGGASTNSTTLTSTAAGGAGGMSTSAGAAGAGGASSTTDLGSTTDGSGGGANPTFQPCPRDGSPCLILPLGDSITEGIGVDGGGAYRIELFRLARRAGHDISFVGSLINGPTSVDGVPFPRNHEGRGGWQIVELNQLIPTPAFSTLPHIVLLMIGTEDIRLEDNLGEAPQQLGMLLDAIAETAPDALVVVAQLTPLTYKTDLIANYNAAVPGIVQSRIDEGKHLLLVDQHTGFPTSELVDEVHPGVEGYARMAGVWYAAIEPYLR